MREHACRISKIAGSSEDLDTSGVSSNGVSQPGHNFLSHLNDWEQNHSKALCAWITVTSLILTAVGAFECSAP